MRHVVVLAGRRIDAPGAPERFPLRNRDLVCARIAVRLRTADPVALVASGACGADLLAHQAARALGVRSRLVLPFPAERFRLTSVVDRPGDWGPVFDDVVRVAELAPPPRDAGDGDEAYRAANALLVAEAAAIASSTTPPAPVLALIVWDGTRRGEGDLTQDFADRCAGRGWLVDDTSVSTR